MKFVNINLNCKWHAFTNGVILGLKYPEKFSARFHHSSVSFHFVGEYPFVYRVNFIFNISLEQQTFFHLNIKTSIFPCLCFD